MKKKSNNKIIITITINTQIILNDNDNNGSKK